MLKLPGRPRSPSLLWLAIFASMFRLGDTTFAAESLASYAPANTALFLEVPAPDSAWSEFDQSELAQRWQASALAGLWLNSSFVQHWRAVDAHTKEKSGDTLTHHLRKLFADGVAVIVVLRDKEPAGLLMARAGSPADVAAAIRAWDKLKPAARIESRQHEGRTYHARYVKKPQGEQAIFFAAQGRRFLLSDREQLVRDCLKLWASPNAASLAHQPEFQELLTDGNVAARVYVSPRQWQPALDAVNDHTPGAELLLAGWRKLRGVMAVVSLQEGVLADVAATLEPASLPTGWTDFVRNTRLPGIAHLAPADSLLVLGGRFPVGPLLQGMQQLMSDKDRQEWNKLGDVLQTLLLDTDPWSDAVPALLSDWGGYLVARPSTDQDPPRSHPFVAAAASRWSEQLIDEAGLENALSFGVNALAAAMSSEKGHPPVSLERSRDEESSTWRISGRSWGEFALQLTSQGLTWSSSRTELQQLLNRQASRESAATPLEAASRDRFPQAAAFLWINTRLYRTSAVPAGLQSLAGGQVTPPLFLLNEISRLFDEVFAAVDFDERRISIRAEARVMPSP